ncbi:hypothetical protein BDD12DRAFT_860964 [Trichophaea hybrida]|nr:hypothetical protein BDD12DRAFT_860964 [Trichophaea hybrida]
MTDCQSLAEASEACPPVCRAYHSNSGHCSSDNSTGGRCVCLCVQERLLKSLMNVEILIAFSLISRGSKATIEN